MTEVKRYEITKEQKSTTKVIVESNKDYYYKGKLIQSINFLETTAWSPTAYIYVDDTLKGHVFIDEIKEAGE